MTLDQQIIELESAIHDGEQLSHVLPHVHASLCRLRQISSDPSAPKSLYTDAVESYDAWHKTTLGVRMRFSAAEGKALKEILAYMLNECNNDEAAALHSFQLMLGRWHVLNEFLRSQTKLAQMNKYLTEIITKIKSHAAHQRGSAATKYDSISDKL